MKYCTAKDEKLRLQCLCELCALCGETVNGNLQFAFICVHLRLIFAKIQPYSFIHSLSRLPTFPLACAASAHPAALPAQPHNLTACAQELCMQAAASESGGCGGGSTTQFYNAFTGKRHGFEIYSGVVGAQEFEDGRDIYACR